MTPRSPATTRRGLLAGALAGGVALAGCGSDGSSRAGRAIAETRRVRHPSGTSAVPTRHERVAPPSEVVAHLGIVLAPIVAPVFTLIARRRRLAPP